jgi:FixJ family two-component response regulator
MGVLARTIAVIDDDDASSNRFRTFLHHSAIRRRRTHLPNFFSCRITDVEMRRMSGLGLLQHVRSRQSDVPVIVITGKPSDN